MKKSIRPSRSNTVGSAVSRARISWTLASPSDAADGPALERLAQYRWPGNVRELRNVLQRCKKARRVLVENRRAAALDHVGRTAQKSRNVDPDECGGQQTDC